MTLEESIRKLEQSDGLDGLLAIAEIIDASPNKGKILNLFRALGGREYRARVAGCLAKARINS